MTSELKSPAAEPRKTFKGGNRPTWCPGCGDYGVLGALDRALIAFGRPEHDIAVISGIGCSSRFPYFMNTYGIHSAHGRALPVATGLKIARPDITVIAVGGDGDALAIGGNHFFHAMRRNLDLTYILMDNQIYGMTKGQSAPTSDLGMRTKSSPYGTFEPPVDPAWAALTMGATFVAQVLSSDLAALGNLVLQGLRHPGTAVINCLSPCVTYNKKMDKEYYKAHSFPIEKDYDPTDFEAGIRLLRSSPGRFPLGVIHQRTEPTLEERLDVLGKSAGAKMAATDLESIVSQFL
jgi:2-oxoglutarate ferredoxin oxidoreductase subunit beta